MINISENGGHTTYNVKQFILDTATDLDDLPVNVAPGSTAFVVATGKVYMLNGKREWKEI